MYTIFSHLEHLSSKPDSVDWSGWTVNFTDEIINLIYNDGIHTAPKSRLILRKAAGIQMADAIQIQVHNKYVTVVPHNW